LPKDGVETNIRGFLQRPGCMQEDLATAAMAQFGSGWVWKRSDVMENF
jgi:superoxide dismutase